MLRDELISIHLSPTYVYLFVKECGTKKKHRGQIKVDNIILHIRYGLSLMAKYKELLLQNNKS